MLDNIFVLLLLMKLCANGYFSFMIVFISCVISRMRVAEVSLSKLIRVLFVFLKNTGF